MPKMAVFVEGFTERLLVERLIDEIASRRHVRVRIEEAQGGRGVRRIILISEDADTGQAGFILIRDSRGDEQVASDVRDQYDSLTKNGYVSIVGLRDLYPRALKDLPILLGTSKRSLNFGLRTVPVQVKWVIALMEVEAWFLAEHTHFTRVHLDLTCERILLDLGFDPRIDDMEARAHPAEDLHNVYALVGLAYTKSPVDIPRTVLALDVALIYGSMDHVKQLRLLIDAIDQFVVLCTKVPLTQPPAQPI